MAVKKLERKKAKGHVIVAVSQPFLNFMKLHGNLFHKFIVREILKYWGLSLALTPEIQIYFLGTKTKRNKIYNI